MTSRPDFIKHVSDLPSQTFSYPVDGEEFATRTALSRPLGLSRIGVHHDLLPGGHRTSYPHAESTEEECVYVLEGHPHAFIDGQLHALHPGDFVAFPPGTAVVHSIINNSNLPARLLVIGDRQEDNKVAYPLNPDQLEQLPENMRWRLEAQMDATHAMPSVHKVDPSSVRLRGVAGDDVDTLYNQLTNSSVCDWLLWNGPESKTEFRDSLDRFQRSTDAGDSHFFVVEETATGAAVGCTDIRPQNAHVGDIGLWIAETTWGRGLGTATVYHIAEYGFQTVDLKRVEASIFVGNHGSRRAFEKNGFQHEGTMKAYVMKRGKPKDGWLYAKVSPELQG